jgi:hypothetical protein
MFLPVFVPDLCSSDDPGFAGYALRDVSDDHTEDWRHFDYPTARSRRLRLKPSWLFAISHRPGYTISSCAI